MVGLKLTIVAFKGRGTVRVTLRDPPQCKDDRFMDPPQYKDDRFITKPLKPNSAQVWIIYQC